MGEKQPVKPHLKIRVAFLPTKHGGRHAGAFSGYRGQFYYDGIDCDGEILFGRHNRVDPGETIEAYYYFLRRDVHLPHMHPGKLFLLREGNRCVAYGVVLDVLDENVQEVD